MDFVTYPDREALMMGLAHQIGSELGEVLRATGRASLSVPGGTTPGPVFDMLSAAPIDWANVAVFLNDERWVPESSPRSNTALLRARLLQDKAAAATLIPMVSEAEAPEGALEALAEGIAPHLPISVLLLGMGADMHTASLFPGADRLAEGLAADAPLLLPMRADAAGEPRITLTAPALTSALHIHILITGPEKRAALERAVKLSPSEAPVALVLPHATIHWAE